jgi:hypothetical protein
MNHDGGGWLWLVIDVGFVGILGLALAYGTMQWRPNERPAKAAAGRRDPRPVPIGHGSPRRANALQWQVLLPMRNPRSAVELI